MDGINVLGILGPYKSSPKLVESSTVEAELFNSSTGVQVDVFVISLPESTSLLVFGFGVLFFKASRSKLANIPRGGEYRNEFSFSVVSDI